ncbi:hypothetical protein BST97_05335 [Nonlabens spongiae]|uniref:Lipoprotein n=1 Tax=Nonlabens spongiae TaxID=331648 RepID=A0A1W6MIN3_9FLAO|nr:hypothetical protein [Nonlabens spongiae]ARN77453.1 hypothetical protein BST97_05335 [Nonlabens spongiae]
MIKFYLKLVFSIAIIGCLASGCKDSDADSDQKITSPKNQSSELTTDVSDSKETTELRVISSSNDEGNDNNSTYNPNKVPADLRAFSLSEAMVHNDMKGIQLRMTLEELEAYNVKANQVVEKINTTDVNGNLRTRRVTIGGVPVIELSLSGNIVNAITFLSPNATPKNMIGVDHMYNALKSKYPNPAVSGNQVKVSNDGKSLIFTMEADSPDGVTMPDSAQIVEFTVMNQIES